MKYIKLITVLTFFFFTSCDNENSNQNDSEQKHEIAYMRVANFDKTEHSKGNLQNWQNDENSGSISKNNVKFTKYGYVKFEVKNIKDAQKKVADKIKKFNGEIFSETYENSDYLEAKYYNTNYKISVPKENFDRIISELEQSLGDPAYKKIDVDDFTKQYYDNEARLNHQKAYLEKTMELIKRASGLDDIITLQSKISELQLEIEQMSSSQSQFDFLVGNYWLTLDLKTNIEKRVTEETGFFEKLISSIKSGWFSLENWFYWLISNWHLIIILVFFLFAYRKFRSRKSKLQTN